MTEVIVDNTMVERVAETIWMENRPEGAPIYDELDFLDQGRVKMIARACIKVMREPTEEMVEAGNAAGAPWESEAQDFREAWIAMIDAALKED